MYNECRHIMPSGIRCHAPALRETHFCYFHTNLHRVTAPKTKFDDWSLKLPVLEDRRAIQMALTQVLGELAAGRLDPRRAGLLLYGLQIATKVAARTSMVFLNPVRSLSYEGEDVLAPEKTVCEPPQDCRNCPKSETCDNFMEMEEDDEDEDEEQLPGSVAAVLDKLAGCEEDHGAPHHGQDHSVDPQLAQSCTAQDDPAENLDIVGGRNQAAHSLKEQGHILNQKNVAGEKHRRQHRSHCELECLGLRAALL